jgi:protein-L-isoaspartate O-methyltransferase
VTLSDQLLRQQQTYYQLRAADYDSWVTSYMAPVLTPIVDHMCASELGGQVLEIAPGTGHLTYPLCRLVDHVTAVDIAPEMIAVLAARRLPNLTTICHDVFTWKPPAQFDAIFFSNWLAHVPETRFDAFWSMLASALRQGGRVQVVDVTADEAFIESHVFQQDGEHLVRRNVNGDSFTIFKRFWEPAALLDRLASCGWTGTATPVGAELGRGFVIYDVRRTND